MLDAEFEGILWSYHKQRYHHVRVCRLQDPQPYKTISYADCVKMNSVKVKLLYHPLVVVCTADSCKACL